MSVSQSRRQVAGSGCALVIALAYQLDGVQLGLLNYAANKPRGMRLLPILNYARGS